MGYGHYSSEGTTQDLERAALRGVPHSQCRFPLNGHVLEKERKTEQGHLRLMINNELSNMNRKLLFNSSFLHMICVYHLFNVSFI